jgi:hypothetical protein
VARLSYGSDGGSRRGGIQAAVTFPAGAISLTLRAQLRPSNAPADQRLLAIVYGTAFVDYETSGLVSVFLPTPTFAANGPMTPPPPPDHFTAVTLGIQRRPSGIHVSVQIGDPPGSPQEADIDGPAIPAMTAATIILGCVELDTTGDTVIDDVLVETR